MHWECANEVDFAYMDLSNYSRSAEEVCFDSTSEQRGFHLVIPPEVLEGDSQYQFRIVGRRADDNASPASAASVVISTLAVPQIGTCEVRSHAPRVPFLL